jgi:hypothetical protein
MSPATLLDCIVKKLSHLGHISDVITDKYNDAGGLLGHFTIADLEREMQLFTNTDVLDRMRKATRIPKKSSTAPGVPVKAKSSESNWHNTSWDYDRHRDTDNTPRDRNGYNKRNREDAFGKGGGKSGDRRGKGDWNRGKGSKGKGKGGKGKGKGKGKNGKGSKGGKGYDRDRGGKGYGDRDGKGKGKGYDRDRGKGYDRDRGGKGGKRGGKREDSYRKPQEPHQYERRELWKRNWRDRFYESKPWQDYRRHRDSKSDSLGNYQRQYWRNNQVYHSCTMCEHFGDSEHQYTHEFNICKWITDDNWETVQANQQRADEQSFWTHVSNNSMEVKDDTQVRIMPPIGWEDDGAGNGDDADDVDECEDDSTQQSHHSSAGRGGADDGGGEAAFMLGAAAEITVRCTLSKKAQRAGTLTMNDGTTIGDPSKGIDAYMADSGCIGCTIVKTNEYLALGCDSKTRVAFATAKDSVEQTMITSMGPWTPAFVDCYDDDYEPIQPQMETVGYGVVNTGFKLLMSHVAVTRCKDPAVLSDNSIVYEHNWPHMVFHQSNSSRRYYVKLHMDRQGGFYVQTRPPNAPEIQAYCNSKNFREAMATWEFTVHSLLKKKLPKLVQEAGQPFVNAITARGTLHDRLHCSDRTMDKMIHKRMLDDIDSYPTSAAIKKKCQTQEKSSKNCHG